MSAFRTLSAVVGTVAVSTSVASAAATAPTPVVLSGAASAGGTHTATFGSPVINASGQVAFYGGLTGGSSTEGIFFGTPGAVQTVARTGTVAPGGTGGNYSLIIPAITMNSSGQVAFRSNMTGGSSSQGVFSGAAGSVGAVALINTAAPSGGNYASSFGVPITMNGSGHVAYLSFMSGATSQGIFAGPPGATTTIAHTATASPAGGLFSGFSVPTINASGRSPFVAAMSGPGTVYVGGMFIGGGGGATQSLALMGAAAPGGGNHGTSMSANPSINAAGQVAFHNTLSGGSSTAAIFAGSPGSLTAIARQGDAAPAGGNYDVLGTTPVINNAGQVAFQTTLTGGSSTRGIFLGVPGSTIQPLVLQGDASPDGVGTFDSFAATVATSVALNAAGQVAFTATLAGVGVTTANDTGLFAGSPGDLTAIIREGDVIDVDPTAGIDLRTVSGIGFGQGSGGGDGRNVTLTDNGLLAFRLTFTNGTAGIFTSAIPEPTSLALLIVGAGSLMSRRNRLVNPF